MSVGHAMPSMTSSNPSSGTSGKRFGASGSALASSGFGRALTLVAAAAGSTALALVAIALVPSVAHAWTPGTHVYLGEAVMRSLSLLPPGTADLLRAFP